MLWVYGSRTRSHMDLPQLWEEMKVTGTEKGDNGGAALGKVQQVELDRIRLVVTFEAVEPRTRIWECGLEAIKGSRKNK